jgi:hypothetical protein
MVQFAFATGQVKTVRFFRHGEMKSLAEPDTTCQ